MDGQMGETKGRRLVRGEGPGPAQGELVPGISSTSTINLRC